MAGYLNEDVQKWYKENKDLIGVIETLTKRCKELEKKADLSNAAATHWQHNFFVESARYDELIDTASKLDLENAKLQRTVKQYKDENEELLQKNRDLSKHIYNLKNEVRKLNAACQVKSIKIESLKKKLANKDIRIANNVTEPYLDNDYYRIENLWAILGGMCK